MCSVLVVQFLEFAKISVDHDFVFLNPDKFFAFEKSSFYFLSQIVEFTLQGFESQYFMSLFKIILFLLFFYFTTHFFLSIFSKNSHFLFYFLFIYSFFSSLYFLFTSI
jgi:hypothetical protein